MNTHLLSGLQRSNRLSILVEDLTATIQEADPLLEDIEVEEI